MSDETRLLSEWDPGSEPEPAPRAQSAAPKRRRPWLLRVAIALAVVIGVVGVRAFFAGGTPSALDGYMHGKGVRFAFPGDRLSLRLPETPQTKLADDEVKGGSSAEIYHKTYEVFVVSAEASLDASSDNALAADLESQLDGFAQARKISIEKPVRATIAGRLAVTARGSYKGDETDTAVIYANGRLYLFMVHTKAGSAKVLTELEKSVAVG